MSARPTRPPSAPAGAAAAPAPARRRRRWLLPAVLAPVLLAGLGGAGWFLLPRFLAAPAPAAAPGPAPVRVTVPVGAVVVNLGGDGRRYLRATVSLGVEQPADARALEEARPQLLDLLISVLGGASAETPGSEAERSRLKAALLRRIHEELGLPRVHRVYFTEFVVQ